MQLWHKVNDNVDTLISASQLKDDVSIKSDGEPLVELSHDAVQWETFMFMTLMHCVETPAKDKNEFIVINCTCTVTELA